MSKILKSDNLKLIDDCFDKTFNLFLFKPNVFQLFPKSGNMHKMDVKQRIRFLLLLVHGYQVYVLGDKENNVVGCAVFANGKTYRYPFANASDLICGPYYVMPEFRRRGIATKLLGYIIDNYETEYNSIYAHIWHENCASIDCMQKLGFAVVDTLRTSKILQKCISDKKGELVLVKKENPKR